MLLRCIGTIGVQHADGITGLSKAQRRIISILTAAGPDGLSSAEFADELYADELPTQWEASVRQAITRMRKALPVNTIVTRSGRYALDVAAHDIDVWKLLAVDDLDLRSETEDELVDLLSGEPFPDIELSPLLHQQIEAITEARVRLLNALADHRTQRPADGDRHDDRDDRGGRDDGDEPGGWSSKMLVAARALALRSHYRDDVLAAALRLHDSPAARPNGRLLIERARRYLAAEMAADLGPLSAERAAQVESEPTATPHADATSDARDSEVTARTIGLFDTTPDPGMIGRPALAARIEDFLDGPGVVVTGDSGAGKSALVRSMLLQPDGPNRHVLWLTARRGAPTAYEPFIATMSALGTVLEPLLADGGTELSRSQCWNAVRRRLHAEFPDAPLTIVVDDAHWLDSHSQRLVGFLAAATAAPPSVSLLVIGRDDADAHDWNHFARQLTDAGLGSIHLGEFDHGELVELIGLHHPDASSKQRHDLAGTLAERRAALPVVAHELVRSAQTATLALQRGPVGVQHRDIWTERVGPASRRVAAIAAVVGMRFSVREVAALGDLTVDSVVDAVDDMLDASLLVAEERPDEFSFRHVLIHADFDEVLDRRERRRLHLEASRAAAASGDVHAPLLDSARSFLRRGSFREAVEEYTKARTMALAELAIEDLLDFAEATSMSGGDGWDLRSVAFDRALADGDADRCLDVALSGALRTEDAMGQDRRVAMLERIDSASLNDRRRAVHAAAVARELGLLGRHEAAIDIATAAMKDATTPADALVAWLGAWASCRALPPGQWPSLPEDRHLVEDPELVSRVAQVECALALVLGDDAATRRHLRDFAEHPHTRADPLRSWHADLVETTLLFVDGKWDEHRERANAAFGAASAAGVTAAFSARFAQEFVLQWLTGRHGALLPQFDAAAPDVNASLLAQAAHAVTLAEHAEHRSIATARIADLAERVHEFRSPLAPAAAALLARAPESCRSEEVAGLLRAVLEPFRHSALVVGAALSHAGPAAWALSHVARNDNERATLLEEACAEADDWNLRVWSVVCRRDLAAATGAAEPLRRAAELAAGTPLELVL